MEIILAISLMIMFTISTFSLNSSIQYMKMWSIRELNILKDSSEKVDAIIRNNFIDSSETTFKKYGNFSMIYTLEPFQFTHANYAKGWGGNTCNSRLVFDKEKMKYFSEGVDLGIGNVSTDIKVKNSFIYLVADASSSSKADFFIIDASQRENPHIVSSLNTGPGISAITLAGPYAYLGQASTVNQLQIVDIHNRLSPQLISQLKLPLPTPTTTAPFASAIFYSQGYVYLGTQKWNGAEFNIIDVSNPINPKVVGAFETDTLINDIYVVDDQVYLATSDFEQMEILDIHDKSHPIAIDTFSPSGWQTQEGKTIDYFEDGLAFGRTVGGFNVVTNHEAFLFSTIPHPSMQFSKDISGGVYGILLRNPYIFLLTHSLNHEFQVWDSKLSNKLFEFALGTQPIKMSCDLNSLFFTTGDNRGFLVLDFNT